MVDEAPKTIILIAAIALAFTTIFLVDTFLDTNKTKAAPQSECAK